MWFSKLTVESWKKIIQQEVILKMMMMMMHHAVRIHKGTYRVLEDQQPGHIFVSWYIQKLLHI